MSKRLQNLYETKSETWLPDEVKFIMGGAGLLLGGFMLTSKSTTSKIVGGIMLGSGMTMVASGVYNKRKQAQKSWDVLHVERESLRCNSIIEEISQRSRGKKAQTVVGYRSTDGKKEEMLYFSENSLNARNEFEHPDGHSAFVEASSVSNEKGQKTFSPANIYHFVKHVVINHDIENNGYISFLETPTERFALCMTDRLRAGEFVNNRLNANLNRIKQLYSDARDMYSSLSVRNASILAVREVLLNEQHSGIGFYVSTDTQKTQFARIN